MTPSDVAEWHQQLSDLAYSRGQFWNKVDHGAKARVIRALIAENEAKDAEIERLRGELNGAEDDARRYASYYPPSSDGRNTFLMLADSISARQALNGREEK